MTTATKENAAKVEVKPASKPRHKPSTDVWRDRFRRPTDDQLIAGLDEQGTMLFKTARKWLLGVEDASEDLSWNGIPWRWSFAYWLSAKPAPSDLPLAYLVPDPETPRLGLPMTAQVLAEVKPRKLSKTIREGLVHSTRVANVYWTSWDLQSKTGVQDVLDLVRIKHESLSKA